MFDPDALAEEISEKPPYPLRGVLVETYFVVPVVFSVDGVDLLQSPNGWHMDVPLLHFATEVPRIVASVVASGGPLTYVAPGGSGGYVKFAREQSNVVEVYSSALGHSVPASSVELVEALATFSEETKLVMRRHVPWLRDFPYWNTWLNNRR